MRNALGGQTTAGRTATNQNESPRHTIQLQYHGNRGPRSAPILLQRLLGPTVAQDILQLSTAMYSEGGGSVQLRLQNDDMSAHAVSDDILMEYSWTVCSSIKDYSAI